MPKAKTNKPTKKHRGPEAVKVDLRIVEDMASFGCNNQEIGIICGFGESRFRKIRETYPEIQEALDLGRAKLRQKLRKKQIELALDGNANMLIFLGKAMLEQSDKVEINHTIKAEVEYEITFGETTHQDNDAEASPKADDGSTGPA